MGPHEPYWQTNTSFSPPPSRWDFRFQSEGLPYGLHDGMQFYGSSTSSNEKDGRGWVRGNHLYDLHYSAPDGAGLFLSSPSDIYQGPQWTPPAVQEISIDDYEAATRKDPSASQISFTPTKEGTSENPDSGGSISSQSESSESESTAKARTSQRDFSNHHSFISKPVHPLSFFDLAPAREAFEPAVAGSSEFDGSTPLRDAQRSSSASSSLDFVDVSESFESETSVRLRIPSDGFKCSLCERFVLQRSPWSARRIVRSVDMPTTGVLPCRHVFHAECLEQATPKTRRNDPPCPICAKLEVENSFDQRAILRTKNNIPRLGSFCEDGPSRHRGCVQVGDCVDGARHAPPRNAMLLLNRNRIRKNLSSKGTLNKEFPGKSRKSGPYSSQLFTGSSADEEAIGCSKSIAGPSMKK